MATRSMCRRLAGDNFQCIKRSHEGTKNTRPRKTRRKTKHTKKKGPIMLNIPSPLPDDVEQLMHDTIGCCITVHRALGPGLLERIYSRGVCVELTAAGIPFEREKRYQVWYRDELLADQYLDFVVGN